MADGPDLQDKPPVVSLSLSLMGMDGTKVGGSVPLVEAVGGAEK